ncbi:MAG: hypothetical protein KC516_02275 [Nanoarchaeota archaeon]|nr:hypothetical protein [Nanoarchaeota archaeon]
MKENGLAGVLIDDIGGESNRFNLTKKEKAGLDLIYSVKGKRRVYELYLKNNPEMAQKYLEFVSKNLSESYIKWDDEKKRFTA